MIRYRKVGGMRFLRIGRLQLSWCVVRNPAGAAESRQARAKRRKLQRQELRALRNVNRYYSRSFPAAHVSLEA